LLQLNAIKGPDDASEFLDAKLKVERDWFSGVGRLAAFRIPSFAKQYFALFDKLVEDQQAEAEEGEGDPKEPVDLAEFEAHFIREAKKVTRDLNQNALPHHAGWCDMAYGTAQLRHAREGIPMRFDKAVVAALTLNRRCAQLNYGEAFTIGANEIVASAFFFANLKGLLNKAAEAEKTTFQDIIGRVAAVTGQSESLIGLLAGADAKGPTVNDFEVAATHVAAYQTQHEIARALLTWHPELATKSLRAIIVRRRNGAPNLKALPDETLVRARKVTTGPYAWPKTAADEDHPAPLALARR
jgi:hypothetical protein